jgi:hypothetical protein
VPFYPGKAMVSGAPTPVLPPTLESQVMVTVVYAIT